MKDIFDILTPDELTQVDNQIKMLKLELLHNVQLEPFGNGTSPEVAGNFLDSILALEEMQKDPWEVSLYDLIGQPPFQPEAELTNHEVTQALDALLQRMSENNISLTILAPDDYTDRTIYRFVTDVLFRYEITDLSADCKTNFVYEEFYPNARYDVVKQSKKFFKGLINVDFSRFNNCLGDQFLERQLIPHYAVTVRSEVIEHLHELIENFWPRTVREGLVTNVLIAENSETAQTTVMIHLGVEGDSNYVVTEGTIHLVRYDFWWFIDRVVIGDWILV
jgi:hypothetical protein